MRITAIVVIPFLLSALLWLAGCSGGGTDEVVKPSDPGASLSVSASPATFTTPDGQATITFTNSVPVYNPGLTILDGSGTTVRTLFSDSVIDAGTHQAVWDGKDNAGQAVAAGQYRMVFSGNASNGNAMTPATATVNVQAGSVTPPPPPADTTEKGQIIEGAGSSNWDWTKYVGYKVGISFEAPKSGTITQVTLQWKKSGGYGSGTYGKYNFELQPDGAGHFPSGTVIASAQNVDPVAAMDGYADGALHFPITAVLTAGQIYHLVIYNVDPNPGANWSSPNGLMTRVQPWDGTGNRTCYYSGGSWKPYGSRNDPWNTAGSNNVNGHYTPTMLSWSDGTNTGAPYYSARMSQGAFFYGNNRAGESIAWDDPDTTISRIGLSVKRVGTPGGPLIYHLEQVGSGDLASGTLSADGSELNTGYQSWAYATLPAPVALRQGATYRLWFESPGSGSANCYYTAPVYGESRPSAWNALSWGGTRSCYIYGSGNLSSSMTTGDLSFSLQ